MNDVMKILRGRSGKVVFNLSYQDQGLKFRTKNHFATYGEYVSELAEQNSLRIKNVLIDSGRFEQGCSYFRLSRLIFPQIQNYAVQGDEIQLSIATEQPERYEVMIDPAQAPTRLNTALSSAVMYLTLIRECFS